MLVLAIHPVPVVHVPFGGRNPRLGFFRASVAVDIPEIGVGEAEALPLPGFEDAPDGAGDLALYGGRIWQALGSPTSRATATDLGALMEDRPDACADPRTWRALQRAIVRTPLGACHDPADRAMLPTPSRADRGSGRERARRIVSDGSASAATAARDFAQEEFLLVGGVPHRRVTPMAWVYAMRSSVHVGLHVTVDGKRTVTELDGMPATPWTLSDVEEVMAGAGDCATIRNGLSDEWAKLSQDAFGDAAEVAVANALPGALRHRMDRDLPPRAERPGYDRLAALEIRGMTCSLSGAELAPALSAVAEGCDTLMSNLDSDWARMCRLDRDRLPFDRVARFVREVALPSLSAKSDDEDALSAVAGMR